MLFLSQKLRQKTVSIICVLLILVLGLSSCFLKLQTSQASLVDEFNQQIKNAVEEQKQLEDQAQKYKNLVQEKKKEILNLNHQLSLMQIEVDQLNNQIELTENKIAQTNLEILKTQYEIEQKQAEIDLHKEDLAEILRTVYRQEQTSLVEIVLQNETLSDFFDHLIYLDSLQTQIQKAVNQLTDFKNQLNQYYQEQQVYRSDLENYKLSLNEDKESLEYKKEVREDLLLTTQGEEKKYQSLLQQIEAQKRMILGNIDQLRRERAQELARLEAQQEKPHQGLASETWYFNQTDPRWGTSRIGLSRSLIKDYGCAVTSVAMVLKYYGVNIDPGQLARQKIFWYNLIMWPDQWQGIELIENSKHQGVDWLRIDQEIAAGHPVIVYIKAIGSGSGHYVVIHHKTADGRYVVHDPYWGPNIYLSSSEAFLSKLFGTTTQIDQMVIYH